MLFAYDVDRCYV
uniref:Uncharacterized protein n=1 Tax=Anguilla anguilla TaxID=7936 RepID=A0A0E9VQT0_ANGAN